jgi:hypothetical protein
MASLHDASYLVVATARTHHLFALKGDAACSALGCESALSAPARRFTYLTRIRCIAHTRTHTLCCRGQEVQKLKRHYNHFMYQALLHCAKNSMNALKNRIQSRVAAAAAGAGKAPAQKPFFEVRAPLVCAATQALAVV